MTFRTQFLLPIALVALLCKATLANISIAISESQQPPVWSIEVLARSGLFLNMVAPNGRVIEPEPDFHFSEDLLPAGMIQFEETFSTLESALDFVGGTWSTSEVKSLLSERSDIFSRQFSISSISADEINRSIPVVSSPSAGFQAQNGEPFLLAWDYEPVSEADEAPNRSVIIRRTTSPPENGFSRSIRRTPSGTSSGYGMSGGADFNTRLEAEPGATSNRWLFTATSNRWLPQSFEVQIGSWFELDEFIESPLWNPDDPNSRPIVKMTYARYAQPISIDLVGNEIEFACEIPRGRLIGDFDGDGFVGFKDFLKLSHNFGQLATTYEEGDTDCDNFIGFRDYLTFAANFGRTRSVSAIAAPEPSLFVVMIPMLGLVRLTRRPTR